MPLDDRPPPLRPFTAIANPPESDQLFLSIRQCSWYTVFCERRAYLSVPRSGSGCSRGLLSPGLSFTTFECCTGHPGTWYPMHFFCSGCLPSGVSRYIWYGPPGDRDVGRSTCTHGSSYGVCRNAFGPMWIGTQLVYYTPPVIGSVNAVLTRLNTLLGGTVRFSPRRWNWSVHGSPEFRSPKSKMFLPRGAKIRGHSFKEETAPGFEACISHPGMWWVGPSILKTCTSDAEWRKDRGGAHRSPALRGGCSTGPASDVVGGPRYL
jgi:hypothetical protein